MQRRRTDARVSRVMSRGREVKGVCDGGVCEVSGRDEGDGEEAEEEEEGEEVREEYSCAE